MATQSYRDLLQQQFLQLQNIQDEEKEARNAYRALVQKEPNVGFFEKERSFTDALKDPTKAQSSFFTGFGLALAASDSTNSLSSRIAGALGVGAKGMQETREKQLTREQMLAKYDLQEYQIKRQQLESQRNLKKLGFDADRSTREEDRADKRLKISQDTQDITEATFDAKNQDIDIARNAILAVGNETIKFDNNTEISVLDPRAISAFKQAKILAEDPSILNQPDNKNLTENEIFGKIVADAMSNQFGAKTKPNPKYNKQFIDQLEKAATSKSVVNGKDENAEFFATLAAGGYGDKTTDALKSYRLNAFRKTQEYKNAMEKALKIAKQKGKVINDRTRLLIEQKILEDKIDKQSGL